MFVCVQEKKERELQGKNEREAAAILASISSGGEGGEGGGRGGPRYVSKSEVSIHVSK